MSKLILGLGGLVAIVVVAGAGWFFFLREDAPEEVSLDSALQSLNTPASGTTPGTGGTTAAGASPTSVATNTTASQASDVNGTWVPDTTQQTFLGYRVVEELARIGTTTAVGRTSAITGRVMIADDTVTAATITADLTKLASDSSQRDGQLRNQAIETSKFPTATFELTESIDLPAGFANGEALKTTLKGNLTLHGVTKAVEIPAEGKIQNGLLVVVGSTTILFADYNINKPSGASVLSIEDKGVLEIQLILKKG